jgi:hypothetical protein
MRSETTLLLCTGGSPPSCLLLICIQESLSDMPQNLEIALHTLLIQLLWRTFFAFVEFRLMDVADDIMTYIEISLVYWNNQSS